MMASLFSGVSGLRNHQVRMNVIGNNIANINTIGYKASRVNFQEALVQTFKGAGRPTSITGGTNPVQLGLGMQVATVDNLFLQGGLETTGQITDLAIQGSGFFILGDNNNNTFYTRAGAFGFDANSNLVDPATGLFVLGKMADSSGSIPALSTTGQITLPFGQQDPAQATTGIKLANNLDTSATDSNATLISAGTTQIQTVSGIADNGVGGTHTITVIGNQATNSIFTSTHSAANIAANSMTMATTLAAVGVLDSTGFSLTIDGNATSITVASTASTVEELITAINQQTGSAVQAELIGGQIKLTRTRAGSQADYSIVSSVGVLDGTDDNISSIIFGAADGANFASAGGLATTLAASDSFLPSSGAAAPTISSLSLVYDQISGSVIGLSGLGGGGVSIDAANGLAAGTVVIDTASTLHTTSINVFDSQGGRHTLSLEFFKSLSPNRWEWTAAMTNNENIISGGSGYVTFNSDSSLNTFAYTGGVNTITVDPRNGASNMSITINSGTVGNYDGLTGFESSGHTASIIGQDGYGLGILEKISIDKSGNISGIFSNGISRRLAQIMLADFTNQAGLRKAGGSRYQTTANSGQAIEGLAGETISGTISSGALESSSVDIAQEFTSMITAQRGFQANARIITTSDNMLDELVNIKR